MLLYFCCFCLTLIQATFVLSERPVVHVAEQDIVTSRIKSNTVLVDELSDLDKTSNKIIEIDEKILELEKNGRELLTGLDENEICTIKLRFRIQILIRDAREAIDICVRGNLNKTDILHLNQEQESCITYVIHTVKEAIKSLDAPVEQCKGFVIVNE